MFLEIMYVKDVMDCNTKHSRVLLIKNVLFSWVLETCKFEKRDYTCSELLKW